MESRKSINSLLMSEMIFPLIVGIACAAIFAGTHMYVVYHTGAFNEIFVIQMLDKGLKGGDFTAAAGFSLSFLLARVLEGPLVGILDIGGAILTGVGIGIPAIMLASGINAPVMSFPLALLTGLVIGIAIGGLIIIIRKLVPNGIASGGTGIMMGAGNATGRYLGPLIILSAIEYGIPTGIGAFIGGAIFYKFDRPIVGGAILGAMIAGGLFIK
jgi:uncharacterized protein (TIGR03579 family)